MSKNTYTGVDPADFENSHRFMAEELLSPWAKHADSIRMNMFTSHVSQAVSLVHPEPPLIYTGFEKQVGEVSSARRLAASPLILHRVIRKHEALVVYVLVDPVALVASTVEVPVARKITECFGYSVRDGLAGLEEGAEVPAGRRLFDTEEWDEHGNFSYGANLKGVYAPLWGMTYEDGVVVSESAAARMSTTVVQEIKVSLNTNDILINCYGDDEGTYVPFPSIGEETIDRVLCSRRRLNFQSVYADFARDRIGEINFSTDDVFFADGVVIDVEVYSNAPVEQLERSAFNSTILERLRANTAYYEAVRSCLTGLKEQGYSLDADAGFALQRAKTMLSEDYKFVDDGRSDFDNMILRFRVAAELPLTEGSKITGRYGNKGTVSVILPDDKMPVAADGQRADIILNVLGVVNRLNAPQLWEQEINYIGNELVKRMRKMSDPAERYALYQKFTKAVMPRDHGARMRKRLLKLSDEELATYMDSVMAEGIRLMVPPFYGCPDFFAVHALYEQFGVKPIQMTIPAPEGVVSPEHELVIGNMYFIRLKHDAEGKFSARSAGALSLASIPSKNNKNFKESKAPYPKTAVRLGEMELVNMFALGDIQELYRFLSLYSSSEADRKELIRRLLGTEMSGESVYRIGKVEKMKDAPSLPQTILSEYFACMSLELAKADGSPVVPPRRRRAPRAVKE